MARIELWNGDICDLEVDAIVSPSSTSLWMSAGVAAELKRAGGDAIEFAAVRQAPVPIGGAITALFVIERLWTSKLFEGPDEGAISQISTE